MRVGGWERSRGSLRKDDTHKSRRVHNFEEGFSDQNLNFASKNALLKEAFQVRTAFLRRKCSLLKKSLRVAVSVGSGRVVSVGRSPIHFFDLILNNALALRAGQNVSSE